MLYEFGELSLKDQFAPVWERGAQRAASRWARSARSW